MSRDSEVAQIDRLASLLRDVQRSGGRDKWDHLKSHGHSFATLRSAILRGYLKENRFRCYEIVDEEVCVFFIWVNAWKAVLRERGA